MHDIRSVRKCILPWLILTLASAQNILRVDDGAVVAGDTAWVTLSMDNTDEVVSLQVDLSFPANIAYGGVAQLSGRSVNHILYATMIDGNLRVLSYSPNLTPFDGNSGVLLTLGFTTGMPYDTVGIEMIDPILGNLNSENIVTSFENGTLIITSPEPQLTPFTQTTINED